MGFSSKNGRLSFWFMDLRRRNFSAAYLFLGLHQQADKPDQIMESLGGLSLGIRLIWAIGIQLCLKGFVIDFDFHAVSLLKIKRLSERRGVGNCRMTLPPSLTPAKQMWLRSSHGSASRRRSAKQAAAPRLIVIVFSMEVNHAA